MTLAFAPERIEHWRRPNRPPKVAEQTLPSTWEMPSFAKDERPDHPTPKPLDAFGIPMRQHVARGGLCYEPFSGSGSRARSAMPGSPGPRGPPR